MNKMREICQENDQDMGKMRILIQRMGSYMNQQEKDIWASGREPRKSNTLQMYFYKE